MSDCDKPDSLIGPLINSCLLFPEWAGACSVRTTWPQRPATCTGEEVTGFPFIVCTNWQDGHQVLHRKSRALITSVSLFLLLDFLPSFVWLCYDVFACVVRIRLERAAMTCSASRRHSTGTDIRVCLSRNPIDPTTPNRVSCSTSRRFLRISKHVFCVVSTIFSSHFFVIEFCLIWLDLSLCFETHII